MIPEAAIKADAQSLYEVLAGVPDGRKPRGKRYSVALVLTLLLLAKMSGESKLSGVSQWARLRIDWVRVHLSIKRDKLPCANTYQNVCDQIDLAALNSRLADFFALPLVEQPVEAEASVATTAVAESTELKTAEIESGSAQPAPAAPSEMAAPVPHQWVLDGKTLCGSHRLGQGKQAQSTLALYDLESRHVVAQRPLAGKGHERATALALVQELDLHGVLLSADALHTQPAWCHCVRRQGGDYLLIAKANQRTLYADIAYLFSEQPRPWMPEQHARQVNQDHGRLTIRSLRTSCQLNDYLAPTWPAVAQVFQLQRVVHRCNRTTTETVYGLTSLNPALTLPERLLYYIRRYWEIENRLHWRRDVTLGEDACTVSRGQTPQVLAALNNAILALSDRLHINNLAAQRRIFAARPDDALKLLLHPL